MQTQCAILDPAQLVDVVPARNVDQIVAKLFLWAWQGKTAPQALGRMQLIADPAEANDLLSRSLDFPKCYSFLTELGRSRLDADGDDWLQRRNLTQPLYRDAARSANRAVLREFYAHWLTDDAMQGGMIGRALLAASAEVFLHALGGTSETGPIADWLISLRETAIIAQHVAMFDPSSAQLAALQQRVVRQRQELRTLLRRDQRLAEHFSHRLQGFDQTFDLLGEITINLFAGTETSVSSICWALNLLARHPEIQEAISVDLVRNGPSAPALSHFIAETMRFCPPVPLLVRTVASDGETLAGRPVARGQMIALSIVGLHHHGQHWHEPSRFDPARSEFTQNTYHRRAYLPFSAGPRVCGGIGLARAELEIALAHILQHYQIAPVAGPVQYEYSLTLRPLGTASLQFTRRNNSA